MASVYKKGERWWLRFKGADGRWQGAPAKAETKPAARLEALERERLARQQREGLAPSSDNQRRTFGELMDLWQERYGSRLRSQTIQQSVEKHLRPALGKLRLGGAATELPALLNSKISALSPSSLNHLRAYCHRLYAVASMRSVGWWMLPNPINRLELPKFKEARRKRATVAAEDVPRVLAALTPGWRPLFASAFFLGLRRGELLALQKEDIDLREWTINVRRSGNADGPRAATTGRFRSRSHCGPISTPQSSCRRRNGSSRRRTARNARRTRTSRPSCAGLSAAPVSSKATSTAAVGLAAGTLSLRPTARTVAARRTTARSGSGRCRRRALSSTRSATPPRHCSRAPRCIPPSRRRSSATRTSRPRSPSTRTSTASRTCAPRSRSSTSVRSQNARPRQSFRSEKKRPLLPICYRQPFSQKMRPLTAPTMSGRSEASVSRGDWI